MYEYTIITREEVKAHAKVFGATVSVYLILKMYAMKENIAYPSQRTLSEWTGFTTRAVRKALKTLKERGLIRQVGYQKGLIKTAIYKIVALEKEAVSNEQLIPNTLVSTPPKIVPIDKENKFLSGRNNGSGRIGSNVPTKNKKEKKEDNYDEKSPIKINPIYLLPRLD